jgi:hypothetical protein
VSAWGIFHTDSDDRHVLPVDPHGFVLNWHCADLACWCQPHRDAIDTTIVIHNDRERGGFDA